MITEIERIEDKALSVPEQARRVTIASNENYLDAEFLLQSWKNVENEIHGAFDPIVEKAFAAHKEAVAQRKKYLDPVEEGRKILKPKMISFQAEQEKIRQEKQREADIAAQKRAEEEALAAAAQAEAEGDHEAADAIISEPVQVAPVIVPRTAPAPSRLSAGRTTWYAVVTDIKKLCAAIGTGTQPTEYAIGLVRNKETGDISSPTLNTFATRLQSTMSIPGVVSKSKIG